MNNSDNIYLILRWLCNICGCVLLNTYPLLVVIFPKKRFQLCWQAETLNTVIISSADNHCPAELLQSKYIVSVQRWSQHWFEKHHRRWVFVVLDEFCNSCCSEYCWIVRIKTKFMVFLFYSCMQRPPVFPEWDREEVVVLCRISEQKSSFGFSLQQLFSLITVHLSPIVATRGDFFQVRYEKMYIVVLWVILDFPIIGVNNISLSKLLLIWLRLLPILLWHERAHAVDWLIEGTIFLLKLIG